MKTLQNALVLIYVTGIVGLSSCASMSPAGLAKLSGIDPLSADPQQISVAVRLPESLMLKTGDLMMVVKTEGAVGPDAIDETFFLAVGETAAAGTGLEAPKDGERLQSARVAAQDFGRLRTIQTRARSLNAANGAKGKGSLTVSAKGGCKASDPGNEPLKLTIYMQTETGGDWFTVVNPLDLRNALGEAVLAKIPAC